MDKKTNYCYPIFSRFKDERKKAVTPRKYVLVLFGALLLAALLLIPFSRNANPTSIGKPDGKSNVQPAPGALVVDQLSDISVSVSLPHMQYQQLQELNRNFMMKYPHIQVELSNEPNKERAYDLWALESQQREAADIMLLDNGWVRSFAVRGFLKPADSIMTGDTLTDQMTGLLDSLKWNGYLWGVPKDLNPYIIVWNSALLKEAGFKEPPSDFDSLQTAALKTLELHPQASILNLSAGDLHQQLIWLAAFQTKPSNLLKMLPLNEQQAQQLEWLQQMEANLSRIDVDAMSQLTEAFQSNGLLAAVIPWNQYESINEDLRMKLSIDHEQVYYPWLNGRSYTISSNSDNEEEAMLWIGEMTDLMNQQMTYDRLGYLPARSSLYSFNSSLQSEQIHIPPAWWKKVLNTKLSDENIPISDPLWPEKWLQREQLWKKHSEGAFQMAAYIDSLVVLEK